jgi:hypothetical protein
MLECGASPNTTCTHNHGSWKATDQVGGAPSHSVLDVINDALRELMPDETLELLEIFNQQKTRLRKLPPKYVSKAVNSANWGG